MARGRISRVPVVRAPRRLTRWGLIIPFTTTQTAAGGELNASLTAIALAQRPFTIVRTYLEVLITSDQQAASEIQVGAIGMAVVSDQAVAAGTASIPTPVTDGDSDLFFVHQFLQSALTTFGAGSTTELSRYHIDSKAMRKVNSDSDMIITTELSAIGSGIVLVVSGRFLIKLH